jgi:ferredoxin
MIELDRLADAVAGWRKVQIDSARCLPQISARSDCSACAAVCPEGAITLGASPTVKDCSGCGLCAASCRADAIIIDDPSDEQLVQRFAAVSRKAARLSLTCMHGPAGAEQVGCLGRLTPELLLAGAACGFTEIDLVAGPCAGCQYASGRSMGVAAVDTARQVLQALNHACQIRLVEARAWQPAAAKPAAGRETGSKQTSPAVAAPVYEERRAFLLSAFGLLREMLPLVPARTAAAQAAQAARGGAAAAVPRLSRRRELLRWALAQSPGAGQASVPWGEAGVRLSGRCLHCGVCQRLCPNGAIQVAGEAGLQLDPGRCHACGLCTRVCAVGALSLGAPYSLGDVAAGAPAALGEAKAYHCAHCGEPVTATGEGEPLCLPCTFRLQHQEVLAP